MNNGNLHERASFLKKHYKEEIVKSIYLGVYSSSKNIDNFSTWLLAICAGALSIIVSSSSSLTNQYGKEGLQFALASLGLSCIIGIASKFIFLIIRTNIEVSEEVDKKLSVLAKEHTEKQLEFEKISQKTGESYDITVDFLEAVKTFNEPFPKYARKLFFKLLNKNHEDRLWSYKRAAKLFTWQDFLVLLQIAMFLLFIIVVFFSI